jgi:pyruvate dehydrogenase E1 component alpha subunit
MAQLEDRETDGEEAVPDALAGPAGHALAVEMLRRMLRIRRFEEAAIELYNGAELPGAVHLSIGQEGGIVGACLAARRSDWMTGNHRSHGHPIAKGAELRGLMAELLGKATGVCGGKGGSMHLADFSVGSLGESGIVASAIPVATGAGFAAQTRGDGRVVLCFFGEGASNEGVFHESLNFASVWQLPVVYLCENNDYAVTVRSEAVTSVRDIATRAVAYAMPGVVVDGQDVVASHRAVTQAIERARAGGGPTLVELKTFRFDEHAHGLRVAEPYRTEEQARGSVDEEGRDPIPLFVARALAWGVLSENEVAALEQEVAETVADALAFARESPYPDASEAWTDVYADDAGTGVAA